MKFEVNKDSQNNIVYNKSYLNTNTILMTFYY